MSGRSASSSLLVAVAILAAACASTESAAPPVITEDPPAAASTTANTQPGHHLFVEGRGSDATVEAWASQIYPGFLAEHPDFQLEDSPIQGAGFNAEILGRLEAGTAGDIITCRAFVQPADLFEAGFLVDLSGEPFLDRFDDRGLEGWRTPDGDSVSCIPVASVTQGIFYNADAMAELGLQQPETLDDWFAMLRAVEEDGRYVPVALGTKTPSRAVNALLYNIGPTFWGGDVGRQAIIDGELKLDDQTFVDLFTAIDDLAPFLPEAFEFMNNVEARDLFVSGGAVFYPGGSWEIGALGAPDFDLRVMAVPPLEVGGTCYMTNHHDAGLGVNPAGDVQGSLTFLDWASGDDFAERFTTAFPGHFSLQVDAPAPLDPLGAELYGLLNRCENATRLDSAFLDQSPIPRMATFRDASNAVLEQTGEPVDQVALLQADLDSWYSPEDG